MNRILKKAKSLCAVFLAGTLAFLTTPQIYAENEGATDPGDDNNPYVYSITIEFGSFDFYYDYGTWNTETLKYAANYSSANPAAGTTPGEPGWYGFDGITNKITVTNGSINSELSPVEVKIEFTDNDNTDTNANFPLKSGSISMTCYDDIALSSPTTSKVTMGNGCIFEVAAPTDAPNPTVRDIYVSFEGAPKNADGTNFKNTSPTIIGYITLTVSLPTTELTDTEG